MNRPQKEFLRFLIFCVVAAGAVFCGIKCRGSDISKGYAFTPTDRVTSTKLNNEVDLATINTTFVTDKASAQPVDADSILFYQASSGLFRKSTLALGVTANTNLIMGRTEDTSPATNDFVLTYDMSAGVLKRVALGNLLPLSSFPELVIPPDIGFKLYFTSNNVPFWTSMTNAFQQAYRFWQLANPSNAVSDPTNYFLSARGVPVKTDALLIWAGTNKYITLSNLVTLSAAATLATNGDFMWGYSTNDGQIATFTPRQLQKYITNSVQSPTLALTNKLPQTFISTAVGLGNGILVNVAHGLGSTPQCVRWVLVQTNSAADVSWGQNREVGIEAFVTSTGIPWFAGEADGTTLILTAASTGTLQVRDASSGALGNVNTGKWVAKCYATYFPTFP